MSATEDDTTQTESEDWSGPFLFGVLPNRNMLRYAAKACVCLTLALQSTARWNLHSVAGMDSGTARNLLQPDVSASCVPPTDNVRTFAAMKLQYLLIVSKENIPMRRGAASACADHGCDKLVDPASKRAKHLAA